MGWVLTLSFGHGLLNVVEQVFGQATPFKRVCPKSIEQEVFGKAAAMFRGIDLHILSAPNHNSQIAGDLKSWRPDRKIAVLGSSNRTFTSRDLWFVPLFKSPLELQG